MTTLLQKISIDLKSFEEYKGFLNFLQENIEEKNKKAFELYMMSLKKEIPKVWEKYLMDYKSNIEYEQYLKLKKKFEKENNERIS